MPKKRVPCRDAASGRFVGASKDPRDFPDEQFGRVVLSSSVDIEGMSREQVWGNFVAPCYSAFFKRSTEMQTQLRIYHTSPDTENMPWRGDDEKEVYGYLEDRYAALQLGADVEVYANSVEEAVKSKRKKERQVVSKAVQSAKKKFKANTDEAVLATRASFKSQGKQTLSEPRGVGGWRRQSDENEAVEDEEVRGFRCGRPES